VDVIRVRAPSSAHAERLLAALDEGFAATLDGDSPAAEVAVTLDSQTATKLVELFDALGLWLSSGGLDAVQIGLGARTYTLLPATEGKPNDPTAFLLERTIQLQTALDSRIVIEQAKGILAERESITLNEAFEKIRREARSKRIRIHDLAAEIVATAGTPAERLES
jgi:ANTAR domain